MADRIKGITIEIDGNTKGLSQALKGVNKDIKSTQTQLKDVEKLLKLDPHNVTLLGQKMSLLGKEISETKEKLSQLKSVSDKMNEGLKNGTVTTEQYDAWQREIIETENELKNLQEEISKVPTKSEAMLANISEHFDALGGKVSAVGDKISGLGDALMPVSAGITALGTASIGAWSELDDALDTLVKMTGASGETLEGFEDIVNSIATTIPTDFMTASRAVGEINTRFDITGEELEKLSLAFIKFSELNGTDVVGSVDQVSQMMKAWGVETKDATRILDLLNGVSQSTGISADNLANLMQDNALFFKEFNLTTAQSATLLGSMEKNGIDASVGVTALKTAMAKAVEEGKTLPELLRDFQWTVENPAVSNLDKLEMAKDLFGGKAYAQILTAMQEGNLSFLNISGSMSDYSHNVEDTFREIQDPIDEFTTALNELKLLGAEIGEEVIPVLVDVLKDIKPILDEIKQAWEAMSPEDQKKLIESLGKIALLAPALSTSGRVISGLGHGISGLAKAGKALSSLGIGAKIASIFGSGAGASAGATAGASIGVTIGTSLIAGIGAALGGGAVGKLLDNYVIAPILELFGSDSASWYKNFKWFGEGGFFDELFDFNSLNEALEVYKGAFKQMGEDAKSNLNNMKTAVQTIWSNLSEEAKGASLGLTTAVAQNWETIKSNAIEKWETIKSTVTGAWDNLTSKVTEAKDKILQTFNDVWDGIKYIWDSLGAMFQEGFDIKLPHISVSGGKAPYGIGGQGSLPKFDVEWYANGGILTNPTIFGMQNGRLLGGGESGAEAVLPLSRLEEMITSGMTAALSSGGDTVINVSIDNNSLGSVILTAQQMMNLRRGK